MKFALIFVTIALSSCSPIENTEQYETRYPNTPTMQSAEDAMNGKLFKE
jgi:hypothetical protein